MKNLARASAAALLLVGVTAASNAFAQEVEPNTSAPAAPPTEAPIAAPAPPATATTATATTATAPPAPATTTTTTAPATTTTATAASAVSPDPVPPPGLGRATMLKRYTSWDANLEGGIGRVLSGDGETVGLFRARAGVLVIRDPSFFAIGATYELSHMSAVTLGIQAEYLHIEHGFWLQAGPLLDVESKPRLGLMGALGYSVLGVEVQGRDYGDFGFVSAIFGKVRIPLGIIGFALRGR